MQYKTTKKLFMGTYQYKIVLVCSCSSWFRYNNLQYAERRLQEVDLTKPLKEWQYGIRTQEDLDYANQLLDTLKSIEGYVVRIESPWLSIYTNSHKVINQLANLDQQKVKYICQPAEGRLDKDTIIMPKINYDFKVTLAKTTQSHSSFVEWAEGNSKVKLTKRCARDLNKDKSWGGSYFYITGDKNLLMAKLHLGSCIGKIERIVHS